MTQVHRYEVPVDDQWHTHALSGAVLHIDCRKRDVVEFWALASGGPPVTRHFRAFGTGQDVPDAAVYRGTALTPTGNGRFALDYGLFVWHLFETNDPER